MKKYFLFLSMFLFFSCSKEDSAKEFKFEGQVMWSKTYGGSQEETTGGVIGTPDGGVIVVGHSNSTDGDVNKQYNFRDIWVTKLDKEGAVVWSKIIGGSGEDFGTSIIKTNDSNYVISGYTGSADHDVPRNLGMHDFFIIKINESGTILWSKAYGFSGHDHAHKIIQTRDGGFFIAGFAEYSGLSGQGNNGEGHQMGRGTYGVSVQHGVGEFFGIKLNAQGESQWFRYYGGTQNERVNDIVEANDGGIVMVGYTESSDFDVHESRGSYDYWVIKIDEMGHLHWKKNYGGSGIDQAYGVVKTDYNSYLIVGQTNSSDGDISNSIGNSDVWVIHINDHGDLIWNKSLGGTGFDTAYSIKKAPNNQYVIVGHTRSNDNQFINKGQNDAFIMGIDAQPNSRILWQKTFGGSSFDFATDVTQTSDGSFVLVGDTQSNNGDFNLNKGFNDRFVIKVK